MTAGSARPDFRVEIGTQLVTGVKVPRWVSAVFAANRPDARPHRAIPSRPGDDGGVSGGALPEFGI